MPWLAAMVGGLALLGSVACSSVDEFLKARPAAPAGFLVPPNEMNPHPAETPFHYAGHSPSPEVHQRAAGKSEIYIAPVNLAGLRPIQKAFTRTSYKVLGFERSTDEVANQLRLEFAQVFIDSELSRYRVVRRPSEESVTLELALVELDPTSVTGNAARTVGNYMLTPLVGLASYGTTAGSIAIEGKLSNSATGEVVFQFADREADPLTVFSVRNYQPYAFIDKIIESWAEQFEAFTRTPTFSEVKDTSGFRLNPF